jgi:hypothetical protein
MYNNAHGANEKQQKKLLKSEIDEAKATVFEETSDVVT